MKLLQFIFMAYTNGTLSSRHLKNREFPLDFLNKDGKCVFTDSLSISDVKPGKTQAFSAEVYTEVPEFDEIILLPEKRW